MAEREVPPPTPQTAPANPDPQSSTAGIQPARNSGTYIVQIPREQIYRVPPPENAYLAERYSKPLRNSRFYSCCRGGCGSWCFWTLLVLGLLLLVAAVVFYFLVKPSSPKFTVQHFSVAGAAAAHPVAFRYTVEVGIQNAGVAIGFSSLGGGRAVLTYDGSNVASGKMPSFYQSPNGRGTITLDLSGASYERPPAEIPKRKRPSGAGNITLTLTMAFQLKRRLGPVETQAGGAHVWCTVRVNTLAQGAVKVLNQGCRSEL